jgi:hypothetical protein
MTEETTQTNNVGEFNFEKTDGVKITPEVKDTVESSENKPVENPSVENSEKQPEVIEPLQHVGDSFTISDIAWTEGLGLDETGKTELFDNHKDLFKGKDEVNKYLKLVSESAKINKENQAKKVNDLEENWETSLKTDSDYGKNFESNNKLVVDTMKKFSNETDMAELEKFGFTKSPALKKMILKIAREFEGAKVIKGQQPMVSSEQSKDIYGNTKFDFTKKQ